MFIFIMLYDKSVHYWSFLKNCLLKNSGWLYLFSNGLTGVSYTAKWWLHGVRYTAELLFSSVRYTAELLFSSVRYTSEFLFSSVRYRTESPFCSLWYTAESPFGGVPIWHSRLFYMYSAVYGTLESRCLAVYHTPLSRLFVEYLREYLAKIQIVPELL